MPKKYQLTELEKKAWEFAQNAHKDVLRKFTGDPYFEHVRKVFKLVKKIDTREILGAAALLHDVVEDTEYTIEDIKREFGNEVAKLVKELTSEEDLLDGMGKTEYLLDKMSTMSNDALIIKLCDRLQNLSDHFTASTKFKENYYKQTKYISDKLRIERQLLRPQITVLDLIDGMLEMMDKRYIKNFKSFNE